AEFAPVSWCCSRRWAVVSLGGRVWCAGKSSSARNKTHNSLYLQIFPTRFNVLGKGGGGTWRGRRLRGLSSARPCIRRSGCHVTSLQNSSKPSSTRFLKPSRV